MKKGVVITATDKEGKVLYFSEAEGEFVESFDIADMYKNESEAILSFCGNSEIVPEVYKTREDNCIRAIKLFALNESNIDIDTLAFEDVEVTNTRPMFNVDIIKQIKDVSSDIIMTAAEKLSDDIFALIDVNEIHANACDCNSECIGYETDSIEKCAGCEAELQRALSMKCKNNTEKSDE